MVGSVVEWFRVSKCNHSCWNSVAESFVKSSYLAKTRHAHQVTAEALHILQQSAFLSYVQFELIMLSARNSDKHRWRLNDRSLNTGPLFLISSSVSFGLCVEFVVVTIIREISD